ncbi:MAG: ferritin-like domain-containing protein [Bacteroidetes bacterium]|nr:ferritin-like domain-containing protein [Bacteroidota bacterium]
MKTNTNSRATNRLAKKSKKEESLEESEVIDSALGELFINELKDIYWAEKALSNAIPGMINETTSDELAKALAERLSLTKDHITRVEEVFALIGVSAQLKKCEAMIALIKEAREIVESTQRGYVRDAGIISAIQKAGHYSIATYGTLCAFANILGEEKASTLLTEILNEEIESDKKLSRVAEFSIYFEVADQD